MNEVDDRRDDALAREGTRKAERLARARRRRTDAWSSLVHVVGLGWVVAMPLVLGALAGRLLGRWLGRPSLALVGLGLGLVVSVYGLYRQLKVGLADDMEEEADDGIEKGRDS